MNLLTHFRKSCLNTIIHPSIEPAGISSHSLRTVRRWDSRTSPCLSLMSFADIRIRGPDKDKLDTFYDDLADLDLPNNSGQSTNGRSSSPSSSSASKTTSSTAKKTTKDLTGNSERKFHRGVSSPEKITKSSSWMFSRFSTAATTPTTPTTPPPSTRYPSNQDVKLQEQLERNSSSTFRFTDKVGDNSDQRTNLNSIFPLALLPGMTKYIIVSDPESDEEEESGKSTRKNPRKWADHGGTGILNSESARSKDSSHDSLDSSRSDGFKDKLSGLKTDIGNFFTSPTDRLRGFLRRREGYNAPDACVVTAADTSI